MVNNFNDILRAAANAAPVKRRKPAAPPVPLNVNERLQEEVALQRERIKLRDLERQAVEAGNVNFAWNQANVIFDNPPAAAWGRPVGVRPVRPLPVDDPPNLEEGLEIDPDAWLDLGDDEKPPMPKPEKKVKVRADYSSRAFSTRSTRLPAFRMAYQGLDEMSLRLQGTIIQSHDTTLYVDRIEVVTCDFSGQVGIGAKCTFPDGSRRGVMFNPERTNLRSPDPGYIQISGHALHFHRKPARVYKQGINPENSSFYNVTQGPWSVFGAYPMDDILTSFDERPIIQWNDVWPADYISYRLSDRIAVFRTNGGRTIHAHYKNKLVGIIADRCLTLLDGLESDFWMTRAFAAVGIHINPKG